MFGRGEGGRRVWQQQEIMPWPVSFTHAMSRASFSSSSPPPDDDGYGAVGGDVVLTSAPPSSPNGVAEAAPPPAPAPAAALAPPAAWSCDKTVSLFEFSLCLSRACLGKIIIYIYINGEKDRFVTCIVLRRAALSSLLLPVKPCWCVNDPAPPPPPPPPSAVPKAAAAAAAASPAASSAVVR